ncbi:hypothetical protein [Streptomyces sp. NPDC057257]|uniref:hypothetical protein n=1 Tax=Streptomyces sp. NPDC057257 TaxID=3346071 RepID=UPI00362E1BB2
MAGRIRVDVRRLAAVDMYGAAGSRLRRRVILAEFLSGAVGVPAVGVLVVRSGGAVGWGVGLWLVGMGLNYLPLAVHAVSLSRPGALERELTGVNVPDELRHYTVAQFWVAVPLLFWFLDAARRTGRP